MINDNCKYCLYTEYTEINILINDITGSDYMTCVHKNSPHFEENINHTNYCRLFIDAEKYFLQKDRKDKLNNLKK